MQNNPLEQLSGAYSNTLWTNLEDVLANEDSPAYIYDVLKTLHDSGENKTDIKFVRTLYDVSGRVLPDIIEGLDKTEDASNAYVTELLTDIENFI